MLGKSDFEGFETLYIDSNDDVVLSGEPIVYHKEVKKSKKNLNVRPWENMAKEENSEKYYEIIPKEKVKKCNYCSFNYPEHYFIDWYGEFICHTCSESQCKEMGTTVDDADIEDVVVEKEEEKKIVLVCDEVTNTHKSLESFSFSELVEKVCESFNVNSDDIFFLTGTKPLTGSNYCVLNNGDRIIMKSMLCGGVRRRAKKNVVRGSRPKKKQVKFKRGRGKGPRLGPRGENSGSGGITKLRNVRTLVDEFREDYAYSEDQRNVFNTAVVANSIYWRMNSMYIIQDGGSAAIIPDWSNPGSIGLSGNYRRYRVLKSSIEVRIRNRELVNALEVILFPTDSNAAITTAALFSWRASQPYVIRRQLGPAGASDAKATMRMSFCPSKFVGAQYHDQDQYSGPLSGTGQSLSTDPAVLFYWGLAFYNVNTNTVTTGGALVNMTIYNRVLVYEVNRDANSASLYDMKLVDGALVAMEKCSIGEDDCERSDSSQGRKRKK